MDIVTPALYATSAIITSFVHNVGSRLSQRWLPSSYDNSAWATVEIRRQEIREQQKRFQTQIEETRRLKMDELSKSLENQRILQEETYRLRQWPLPVLPMDILRRSHAANGASLNIILKPVEPREPQLTTPSTPTKAADITSLITSASMVAIDRIRPHFSNDLIFYPDTLPSTRMYGDSLRTALWSLLHTEPVVLMEAYAPKSDRIVFAVSHWGNAFDCISAPQTIPPLTIDIPASFSPDARRVALVTVLTTLVVGLADTFRALHKADEAPTPVFPLLMASTPSAQFSPILWKPVIGSYLQLYDTLATREPLVASEMAAKAACSSRSSGQLEFAEALLDKALTLHPKLRGITKPLDSLLSEAIVSQRSTKGEPSHLEVALAELRGWTPCPVFASSMENDPTKHFRRLSQHSAS